MQNDLDKQYNSIAQKFVDLSYGNEEYTTSNKFSRETFYSTLSSFPKGSKILDIGCGDGTDLLYYGRDGAELFGVDSSEEMVDLAKKKTKLQNIFVTVGEKLPFQDQNFDFVVSKYVIQTTNDIQQILNEVFRVLKPGGSFIYLATHPFRQYFERKELDSDYFDQIIVDSNVFQNQIVFREPTHTFNEYFTSDFFSKFKINHFKEYLDPSAEKIDDRTYPGFFIVVAQKLK